MAITTNKALFNVGISFRPFLSLRYIFRCGTWYLPLHGNDSPTLS